jgi:hypothetical protein
MLVRVFPRRYHPRFTGGGCSIGKPQSLLHGVEKILPKGSTKMQLEIDDVLDKYFAL